MTDPHVRALARRINALEQAVRAQATSAGLAHSSIEDGAVQEYDADGRLVQRIGRQHDGTHVAAPLAGPVPPTPSAPTVEPVVGGVRVTWDGTWEGGAVAPMDHSRVEVHAATSPDFDAASALTLRSTIESPRGGELVAYVTRDVDWWFRLVARSTPGRASAPSVAAGPARAGQVQLADTDLDLEDLQGTTVHYGPAAPESPRGGDLWLAETAPGPPAEYEARRLVDGTWTALADQGAVAALRDAALAAQGAEDAAEAAYQAGQVADAATTAAEAAGDQASSAAGAAAAAERTARGKAAVYRQGTAPSDPGGPGVWYDTSAGNRVSVWSGTAWTPARLGNGAIEPASLVASDVIATGTITAALLEARMILTSALIVGPPTGAHLELGVREGSPYEGLTLFGPDGATPTLRADAATGAVSATGTFRSEDYVEAAQGWMVGADGSAEFQNLAVGGTVAVGSLDAREVTVNGDPLSSVVDQSWRPLGVVGGGAFPDTISNIGVYGNAWVHGVARVRARLTAGRLYRVAFDVSRVFMEPDVSLLWRVVYAVDAVPTANSSALRLQYQPSAPNSSVHITRTFPAPRDGMYYFMAAVSRNSGTGTASVYGGVVYNGFWVEDLGDGSAWDPSLVQYGSAEPPPPTEEAPPPAAPTVRTYTDSFAATWTRSWNQDGSIRDDVDAYQGRTRYYPAGGNSRSMIGFDDANIRARTAGADILGCQLVFRNKHTYLNSGGNAVIGTHGVSARPAGFAGPNILTDRARAAHSKGGTISKALGVTIGRELRDGYSRGIVLGPAPDTGDSWYGYYYGAASAARPVLKITYRK